MEKIICQKDGVCVSCEKELPRGSWAYKNDDDNLICEDCMEEGGGTYGQHLEDID